MTSLHNNNRHGDTVVILNAPPRAGKDSLAEYLRVQQYRSSALSMCNTHTSVYSFKRYPMQLIDKIIDIAGISHDEWEERYYSDLKDFPWVKLGGISQRDFITKVCEEWIKPVFGDKVFGNAARETVLDRLNSSLVDRYHSELIVFTDGGFIEEVEPLVNESTKNNKFNVVIAQWGARDTEYGMFGDKRVKFKENDFNGNVEFLLLPFNPKGSAYQWEEWHSMCRNSVYNFINKKSACDGNS